MSASKIVRILYVENDIGIARLVQKRLQRAGYHVDLAYDGQSGLDLASSGNYDLIAIDQSMPVYEGLEVIRVLTDRGPLPPTVMVTGSGDERTAVEAMKLGVTDYLVKDIEGGFLDLLPSVIERALHQRRLVQEKEQAQEALRQSEEKFRNLFEHANDAIFLIDPETTRFLDFNEAAIRQLGYTREELGQMHLGDIKAPESSAQIEAILQELWEKDHIIFEQIHQRKDGTLIPVEISSRIVEYGGRKVIQSFARDITDRVRAEEEIRDLAKFPDENPYPVLRIAEDGTVLYANPGSSSLLKAWECQVGERVPERWRGIVSEVSASDASREIETESRDRILSLTFAPVVAANYVNVYALDITERRLAEQQLHLQAAALEAAANAIVITDREGAILWANPAFARLTGYTPDQALGKNPRFLKSGQQHNSFYEQMWHTILTGEVWRGELVNRRKDQSLYTEEMTITPVRGAGGEISHFIAIKQDVTARKQAEEALRQRTAELQARNEELDAFSHTVAHDLKGVLGPVIGTAEEVLSWGASTQAEELNEAMSIIARSGRKMNNIIDALLLLAQVRKTEVEMTPLEMAGIVNEALQRLRDIIEERRAEITLPDDWPAATGYGPWVEEIWVNYISNAVRYGGQPPLIELGAELRPNGMVRFWVRDNGPGIPPEKQDTLFIPFTQLGQISTQGHGLGLSIVRRIVEKLGGQIGLESEIGRGSVFHFTLPAATTFPRH